MDDIEQFTLKDVVNINNNPNAQIRNSLLLNAHFIEKEMVVNKVDLPSQKFLKNIASSLEQLQNYKDFDSFAYLTGCSLLLNYDKTFIYNVTKQISAEDAYKSKIISVGRKSIKNSNKSNKKAINFLKSRVSHRVFEDKLVTEDTILKIVGTASNAPSACNRQPCKVIYALTKEENDTIRTVVPDKFVCKNIPNFFAVICDKSFFNKGEELQCYVNGGIFLNNLLLSISAFGLGATAFQTPVLAKPTKNF